MYKLIITAIVLTIFTSCDNHPVSYFCEGQNQEKNIKYKTIPIDTIKLDSIHSSFLGGTIISNERILFLDYRFCWVSQFDKDGKFLSRHLGQGKARNEIPTSYIDGWTMSPDGDFAFMDSSNGLFFADKELQNIRQDMIDLTKDAQKTDKYDCFSETHTFGYDKLQLKMWEDYLYVNIVADGPEFNVFSPNFIDEARVLAKIDTKTGELVDIMGRITPQYVETNGNAFPYMSFDISDKGDLYVAFEVDSLIYVYDNEYRVKDAFGYAGVNMNTNYRRVSMENFRKDYPKEREEKGFYNSVKIIGDYCFRGYNKGIDSQTEGLQIYKNKQLIADVDVPIGFRIGGYIAPYYYSEIIANEPLMSIYRFQLQ